MLKPPIKHHLAHHQLKFKARFAEIAIIAVGFIDLATRTSPHGFFTDPGAA